MLDNTGFSGLFRPRFRDESPGRVHCFHTRLFPGGSAGGSDFFPSPRVADTVGQALFKPGRIKKQEREPRHLC